MEFVLYTQMLMHAIVHRDCTDTVGESALEVDSERKIPCCAGDLNPCQYCAWLGSWMLYQLQLPVFGTLNKRPDEMHVIVHMGCMDTVVRESVLVGESGRVVNSLDFCLALLKSLGCFYFRCVLSSQWKVVTVKLRILQCQL